MRSEYVMEIISFHHVGICGAVQEKIRRYTVKVGNLNQNFGGDVHLTPFVVAVYPLTAIKNQCHLCLSHVLVFP